MMVDDQMRNANLVVDYLRTLDGVVVADLAMEGTRTYVAAFADDFQRLLGGPASDEVLLALDLVARYAALTAVCRVIAGATTVLEVG